MKKNIVKINENHIKTMIRRVINEIGANNSYPTQDSFSKKDLNNILMEIIGYLSNKSEEYSAKIVNQFRKKYLNIDEGKINKKTIVEGESVNEISYNKENLISALKKVNSIVGRVALLRWFNENDIDYYHMTDMDMYIYYLEHNNEIEYI